ncbi:styrene monooxygenase/indole monooxygenase family protein [Oceanobacter mangrovi]|uniref:styrene monooxygenase/indole monooxygenase family protein n=1 Tax=Oceanobacter mangrovi TaxID=2862510 RepID=UPI001C8D6955|nr:styrene monooxygenase/indole monooxygenase family protein [Oceanobacter mangrovi]
MKKIAIIGAGQSGLQLGISLLDKHCEVTIVSNRSGDEILHGRVMSSQSMYDMALTFEREAGISFWDESCPPTEGVHFRIGNSDGMMIDWRARMHAPGQSVDQRIKMPRWMDEFEKRGGKLIIADADIAMLEQLANDHDLVVVSTGKGEIGQLFERDEEKSQFNTPMRTISLSYVNGMLPREDYSALNISVNPGIGEFVNFPCLTINGPADIINLESVPGGPMDIWDTVSTPAEHLALAVKFIREYFPWEAWRCENLSLTDDLGTLWGRVPPTVRKPIGTLPSGKTVLGMADVLVLNDPVTGQGSNNASKCSVIYRDAILDCMTEGDGRFDDSWKQATFDRYWDYAEWVVKFTNTHLLPPPESVLMVMGACQQIPALATTIANSFDDPKSLAPWYYEAAAAEQVIASYSTQTTSQSTAEA